MDIEIGARLKEERERLNLSQAALAEIGGKKKLAQLKYEKGESSPTAAYLAAARRIGVDVLYVITGERTAQHLAPDEAELLALFRAAPLAVKAAAIGALQGGTNKHDAAGKYEGSKQIFNGGVGDVAGRDIVKR
jgi:transcriptional regulator with XRE-family HTH domain